MRSMSMRLMMEEKKPDLLDTRDRSTTIICFTASSATSSREPSSFCITCGAA